MSTSKIQKNTFTFPNVDCLYLCQVSSFTVRTRGHGDRDRDEEPDEDRDEYGSRDRDEDGEEDGDRDLDEEGETD